MDLSRFITGVTIALLGSIVSATPLQADFQEAHPPVPIPDDIDVILRSESDFFDRGREQFDQEIDRLRQDPSESDEALLTIEEFTEDVDEED
ncbi:hypothetical protein PN498_09225 [Oscillatoria sp. CS-180]|uniref:hypothetical protein n=1 Tax=Oscillatoria sp. CS-180 TaxID=3021720 RepID=UPI00233105C2|nr:hypothetical protein [Oscillatoria sp. CS-180]MDB9526165.1 hypothetical protein [Oscillatoria sp. CS-180]